VQFFENSNSLGTVAVAPFKITTGGLAAGSYALAAVATAAGITMTSTVVNVTVVNPVPAIISGTQIRSSQFSFKYAANPGLSYFIQSSSNLLNWTALVTNVASTSPAPFSILFDTARTKFFRVARLPNP
jgi:hypothetical protein